MLMAAYSSSLWADVHKLEHHHRQYEGGYYPGPYYSRAYLQTFPLEPGDRVMLYRLRPFQHYGRYEYGCPIEPGLTHGTVDSYRFTYRYQWGFRATQTLAPVEPSNCDHPLARQYRAIDQDPRSAGGSNTPASIP
jgi:hypothetical protein